ncbi:MAG: hypothetical protein ACK4M9_03690 [Anaerobacillus sp.]
MTYDKMANDKYMPFTLHYMDSPILPYSMPVELEQEVKRYDEK